MKCAVCTPGFVSYWTESLVSAGDRVVVQSIGPGIPLTEGNNVTFTDISNQVSIVVSAGDVHIILHFDNSDPALG